MAEALRILVTAEPRCYGNAMATNSMSIARVYLVSAQEPCSATLTQGETTITWELLTEGGQATVIVPPGATLDLSSPTAMLSRLPETFKSAPAGNIGGSGGKAVHTRGITPTVVEAETPQLTLKHEAWFALHPATTSCCLTPSAEARIVQSHLLLTPADTMPSGWLSATDGAVVRWPFGELAMPAGWSYIITLVQVGNVILANALPVDLSTPAA